MTTPAASTGDVGHDFDPFAPDYLADPYPILDALRERVPVFYAPALDMWVVTRFAEIDEIFRNPARFSAANAQDPIYPLAPEARQILADGFRFTPSMSNCDPPKHTRIQASCPRSPRVASLPSALCGALVIDPSMIVVKTNRKAAN